MTPVDRLLAAFRDHGHEPKPAGKGWTCRCPAHDDRSPSLSIGVGDDGRALVNCHAGCATADVIGAIGLDLRDLMPDNADSRVRRTKPRASGFATARAAVEELERRHGARSALWTYTDAAGSPVGIIVRWNRGEGKKDLRPVSLRAGRWTIGGMAEPRPLYQLPTLANAERVYVTEGEPAADAAIACGLVATTSPHGSKSAAKADWSPLAGRDVVILPDRDDAGERFAETVAEMARKAGARSVRVVRLMKEWADLPPGGDMADALELAGGDADAVRAAVEDLANRTEAEHADAPNQPARFTTFPVDVLPEPVRAYVVAGAKAIGCDASYIALPILSALASTIGNTHRLRLKRSWIEPAIIWTAIVGESGTAKSPALELALRAVRKRQHRAMKQHADAMKAWEADYARWEVDKVAWKKQAAKGGAAGDLPEAPEQPVCQRTWTDDTTTEALVKRLQENPRGLLMVRDELGGWFNFDRYAGGKGGGDAAKWLEVFGGRALIVDRKTSGTEYVPRASVSIAGGIQPETLRRSLCQEHRDSGLAARLLFAMPPRRAKRWTEDDVDERLEASVDDVFDRLYALESALDAEGDPEPRLVTLGAEAKPAWVRFVNEHAAEQLAVVGDEAAAWSKLEGYGARLALVIHLTRAAARDRTLADESVVDEASIAAAVVLVRWFAREAERVYAILSDDDEDRERRRLAEWIEGKGGSVTARDLTKGLRAYRGEPGKARDALAALVEAGYGTWETPEPGRTGGRPTRRFVLAAGVPVPETSAESIGNAGIGDGDSGDGSADDGWGVL